MQVFTNWVNLHLNKRGQDIKDIQNDFSDGEKLCGLMEQLSGKKIPDILLFNNLLFHQCHDLPHTID